MSDPNLPRPGGALPPPPGPQQHPPAAPVQARPRRSKLPIILAAVVVLAAAGVGALFLLRKDDTTTTAADSTPPSGAPAGSTPAPGTAGPGAAPAAGGTVASPPTAGQPASPGTAAAVTPASVGGAGGSLDTSAASAALAKVLDAAATTVPARCPTVDLAAVAAKAPPALHAAEAAAGQQSVTFQELGGKRVLTCVGTAGDVSMRVLAGQPFAGSFEDGLRAALPGFQITFSPQVPLRGGTLSTYCAVGPNNATSCAAQWFTGDLRVGTVTTAAGATAADAAAWLSAALDDIVGSVARAGTGG